MQVKLLPVRAPPRQDMISPMSEENKSDDGNSSDRNLSVTPGIGEDDDLNFPSLCYTQGGIKHFPCENCDKVFTDPSNLQRHIRSQHVGARSHACQECGKTFATSSGLKQHQHIHSSVKPFQCEVCLKAYTQFSNLCRHKRMHADCRQQIKCNDCGQAFSTMTSLSKHRRFCEGMIRSGAATRFGFPATPEKTPKTSALSPPATMTAAYMNPFFPRPPFPFYPPMGTGFPIFPGVMTPPMLPGDKMPSAPSPNMAVSPTGMVPNPLMYSDMKKLETKRGFEGSEGTDISDVSISSDLDSSGSDADSEGGYGDKRPQQSSTPVQNGVKPRLAPDFTPVKPHNRSAIDAIACDLTAKIEQKAAAKAVEKPFDLTKPLTPAGHTSSSNNGSNNTSGGDQPLDLSTKKPQEIIPEDEKTPRKTHIFGKMLTPPEPVVSQNSAAVAVAAANEMQRKLHYAYPLASPMMMDPMYRVDKEKLQSFQEAARIMAFNPAATRLPMPTPTFPMMGLGYMAAAAANQARHDPTKQLPPPMFSKAVNAYHYSPGANKLKERYACKFCGKIFPRSANLTRHLRTHTGEQPYKCKYCERSFSISSNLQRHVRNIHNKEKPFKCPLCDRCFGQQTNLDRHLKKHESDGPNVVDSPPPPHDHELEEKDESYFDEIRNFIGKATMDGGDDIAPMTPHKDYDANFSITAQIEKHNQVTVEKRPSDEEDDEEDDEEQSDKKKPRLENNNSEELEHEKRLTNGFHDSEEEEDVIHGQALLVKGAYELNSMAPAPLACST